MDPFNSCRVQAFEQRSFNLLEDTKNYNNKTERLLSNQSKSVENERQGLVVLLVQLDTAAVWFFRIMAVF